MTPTQGKEYQELRQKLRMIISHASGGALHLPEDIEMSTNDICVQISRHKNELYAEGKRLGFIAGFKRSDNPPPSQERIDAAFEEWKGS